MLTDFWTWADTVQFARDVTSSWPLFAFAFVVAIWTNKQVKELHHGWYGLVLLLPWWPWPVRLVGWGLLVDDAIQHCVQTFVPSYRSPVHRLYARLLRLVGRA